METWQPSTPALTLSNYEQLLAEHKVVVVHFWAAWDIHARPMDVSLQKMRPELDSIAFFSCEIYTAAGEIIAALNGVFTTPTLLCFLNGQHHDTSVGYLRPEQLRAKLSEWLAAST